MPGILFLFKLKPVECWVGSWETTGGLGLVTCWGKWESQANVKSSKQRVPAGLAAFFTHKCAHTSETHTNILCLFLHNMYVRVYLWCVNSVSSTECPCIKNITSHAPHRTLMKAGLYLLRHLHVWSTTEDWTSPCCVGNLNWAKNKWCSKGTLTSICF